LSFSVRFGTLLPGFVLAWLDDGLPLVVIGVFPAADLLVVLLLIFVIVFGLSWIVDYIFSAYFLAFAISDTSFLVYFLVYFFSSGIF
jgi:hypothetical protein